MDRITHSSKNQPKKEKKPTKKTSKLENTTSLGSNPTSEVYSNTVLIANVTVDKLEINVEVIGVEASSSPNIFSNDEAGIEKMILCFYFYKVEGIRIFGKKSLCKGIAEKMIKYGIKILMGGEISLSKSKNKNQERKKMEGMPVLNEFVAGIDIGKTLIYVAVPPHLAKDHIRVFGTNTEDLVDIVKWLKEININSVAMESTSVYWVPLYDLCEKSNIKPFIVNPKHVKMLPGRKTDVVDAQWLLKLLACGLLNGGFVPPIEIRLIRDLCRYRQDLMDQCGDHLNRIHKMLSLMNIQLGNVISDISGKSGMLIIKAILNGERNPKVLAEMADSRCENTEAHIAKALHGMYNESYLFIMNSELNFFENCNSKILKLELKMKELLEALPDVPNLPPLPEVKKKQKKRTYRRSPYSFDLRKLLYQKFSVDLTIIKGIDSSTAAVILLETGGSMDAFPTSKHFASWSGLSPGNKISGGKVLSGKAPKKFSRVGQALRNAANSNYRSESFFGSYMRRLNMRGKTRKSACKATAHKMGDSIYKMMKFGQQYVEIGAKAYEKKYRERKIASCKKILEENGYDCEDLKQKNG
jgi:transposase